MERRTYLKQIVSVGLLSLLSDALIKEGLAQLEGTLDVAKSGIPIAAEDFTIDTANKIITVNKSEFTVLEFYRYLQEKWCDVEMMVEPNVATRYTDKFIEIHPPYKVKKVENLTEGTIKMGDDFYSSIITLG